MGDISEMMLGISASDLFCRDLGHAVRGEPFEDDPDNPKYLPTLPSVGECYTGNSTGLERYELSSGNTTSKKATTTTKTKAEGDKRMNIFESINKVMDEIGAIGKNTKNQAQGFMYRGIDAVMNALNPALVKYKVFVVPEVLEQTREERTSVKRDRDGSERTSTLLYSIIKVKYTFYAEDGSFVTATVIGEGMDSGDKATNKAMSIAFKYACFQVFCIPTEEMVDPDAECHEVKAKTIDLVKQKVVEKKAAELDIPLEHILAMSKLTTLADMTVEQFARLQTMWDQAKAWSDKRKGADNGSKGQS